MSNTEIRLDEYVSAYFLAGRLVSGAPAPHTKLPSTSPIFPSLRTHPPARLAFLTPVEALRLANAMLFAEHQGRWLNSLMTIAWKSCSGTAVSGPEELHGRQAGLLHRLNRVLRDKGWPLFCVWVKENGRVGNRVGVHSHVARHEGCPVSDSKDVRSLRVVEMA